MVSGQFVYNGKFYTQQVKNVKDYFEFFLKKESFDLIIEIGTSYGGLTHIISDIINENKLVSVLHTFDINKNDDRDLFLENNGCVVHIFDVFSDEKKISELIKNNSKVLLLCDGGGKINEFNIYSKYLKSGDFIMAHDYVENESEFLEKFKDKIWNWMEIQFSDIENSVKENSLERYTEINFSTAAWVCFYKK